MSPRLSQVLLVGGVATVCVLGIAWGHLSPRLRRSLALLTSAAGVLFLILALGAEGHREAASVGTVLLHTRYIAETASASASLPYYVLTAVCLLLGTAGLAAPEHVARRLRGRWLPLAIGLSLLVTAVRFALEKAAAPPSWSWAAGVTALAPVVGAVFAWNLRDARRLLGPLVRALLIYGVAVRAGVALLYVAATVFSLGSHYDLSAALITLREPWSQSMATLQPGSFSQLVSVVLVPQLLVWPLYTVVAGLVGAAPVLLVAQARGRLRPAAVTAQNEAHP